MARPTKPTMPRAFAIRPEPRFGRVGIDFNVMKNKHDLYRVLVGARYGYTSFNYDIGPLVIDDPVWRTKDTYEATDQKCSYGWFEAVAVSMPHFGSLSISVGRCATGHGCIRKFPMPANRIMFPVTARKDRRG